jgi:hypothetical protein
MKMLKSLTLMAAAGLFVLGTAHVAAAQDEPAKEAKKEVVHEYVGVTACKMCHSGAAKGAIYESWEKTKHAQSFASLPDDKKTDATCLACHTTGYGKPGGYDPKSETAEKLASVECEACHGPGKDYKAMSVMKDAAKAKEAGLIMPDASTCKGCHEGTVPEGHKALPKFDYAAMVKLVEHHLPKK